MDEVTDRLTYTLKDQALMSRALGYFAWQARMIVPHVGRRVVEVGCGTGNFTRWLLDREAVIAVDIEEECLDSLRRRYPAHPNLRTAICGPGDPDFQALRRFQPDSCVCMNVLEHIEDDESALQSMAEILPPGGVLALLVPAFPALFGPTDSNLGHHRRYTRGSMRRLASRCGLEIDDLRYFNLVGFFGWWLNARVLKLEAQSTRQIEVFERSIVPLMSALESVVRPPFGLSLIAVLRKSKSGTLIARTGTE